MERSDGVSSAAASARRVSRISVADVVGSASEPSAGSPAGGCGGSAGRVSRISVADAVGSGSEPSAGSPAGGCGGSGSAACMRSMRARERSGSAGRLRPLNEDGTRHEQDRREGAVNRRGDGDAAKAAVV